MKGMEIIREPTMTLSVDSLGEPPPLVLTITAKTLLKNQTALFSMKAGSSLGEKLRLFCTTHGHSTVLPTTG